MNSSAESAAHTYIVGFRIGGITVDPELYTLLLMFDGAESGQDRPLMHREMIIWFTDPDHAALAAQLGDEMFRASALADHPVTVIDLTDVLWLIAHADRTKGAEIVTCLNVLLDMVAAIGYPMRPDFKRVIYEFADHLTFTKEYGEFFSNSTITRADVMDAVLWAVGAVAANSRVLKTAESLRNPE